ncbi:hypothetical protein [Nocardiopsis sp. B62]|uniref:hypothetical protein n=1 Tax=Nocardiopsis sp. B62 TaxID=2824874 RepID=UPI001B363979|nr:hypothetical protein [Nocardiopsis sp. B62]MBQ1081164.1 hypothetical protein [Nocardiopsis sp. B62]
MSVFSPELTDREATVPLASFIKPFPAHYFSRTVGTPFRKRKGLGLGLVNALADQWGDNGNPKLRQVWFHLSYNPTNNPWNQIEGER